MMVKAIYIAFNIINIYNASYFFIILKWLIFEENKLFGSILFNLLI